MDCPYFVLPSPYYSHSCYACKQPLPYNYQWQNQLCAPNYAQTPAFLPPQQASEYPPLPLPLPLPLPPSPDAISVPSLAYPDVPADEASWSLILPPICPPTEYLAPEQEPVEFAQVREALPTPPPDTLSDGLSSSSFFTQNSTPSSDRTSSRSSVSSFSGRATEIFSKTAIRVPPTNTEVTHGQRLSPATHIPSTEEELGVKDQLLALDLNDWEISVIMSRRRHITFKDLAFEHSKLHKPISAQALSMRIQRLKDKHPKLREILPARTRTRTTYRRFNEGPVDDTIYVQID